MLFDIFLRYVSSIILEMNKCANKTETRQKNVRHYSIDYQEGTHIDDEFEQLKGLVHKKASMRRGVINRRLLLPALKKCAGYSLYSAPASRFSRNGLETGITESYIIEKHLDTHPGRTNTLP